MSDSTTEQMDAALSSLARRVSAKSKATKTSKAQSSPAKTTTPRTTRRKSMADEKDEEKPASKKSSSSRTSSRTSNRTSSRKTVKSERGESAGATRKSSRTPAKTTTTRKTNTRRTAAHDKETTSTRRTPSLDVDLKKYGDESYTQPELMGGVQLVLSFGALGAIGPTLLALISEWIPAVGEKMEKDAINQLKREIKEKYPRCNADDKKSLRAVIRWVENDFKL